MDTIPVTARADLTDGQWAVLERLLPKGRKPGRPPKWSKRQLIDGAQYGPWATVYGLYRRWQRDGTWARILTGLQALADAAGLITWDVSVDTTIARAHQHAAGAPKREDLQAEPPGGVGGVEPVDHALGRSRVAGPRSCTWAVSRAASCWRCC